MPKLKKVLIISIIIVLIITIAYQVITKIFNIPEKVMKKVYPKEYSEYVEKYSAEYGVDSLLVYAVIKAESNFDDSVVSKSDAKGLMQLMDSTAEEIAGNIIDDTNFETDMLFDAEINIMLGVKYLSELLERYNRKLLFICSCI